MRPSRKRQQPVQLPPYTDEVLARIAEAFPDEVTRVASVDWPTILVGREALLGVCRFLRDEMGFAFLTDVTGVDWLGKTANGEIPRSARNDSQGGGNIGGGNIGGGNIGGGNIGGGNVGGGNIGGGNVGGGNIGGGNIGGGSQGSGGQDGASVIPYEVRNLALPPVIPNEVRNPAVPFRFEVVYHLFSLTHNRRMRLKVRLPESDPHLPSVVELWPTANFHEREVFDFYGIIFDGHPNLTKILTADFMEGHPLRKDFPLGDEEIWDEEGGSIVQQPGSYRTTGPEGVRRFR